MVDSDFSGTGHCKLGDVEIGSAEIAISSTQDTTDCMCPVPSQPIYGQSLVWGLPWGVLGIGATLSMGHYRESRRLSDVGLSPDK